MLSMCCMYVFQIKRWEGGRPSSKERRSKFCRCRFMDASQLTALSVPQLVSLLLALVCELTRRLHTPIELGATIGEAEDVNIDMPAAGASATPSTSSTAHPWATSTPAPGTPSGPMPESQCLHICGIANCDMLCAATCDHGYHRCEHHWWI